MTASFIGRLPMGRLFDHKHNAQPTVRNESLNCNKFPSNACEHRWFSGRMLACHAGGPGSIPGKAFFSDKANSLIKQSNSIHKY